MATGAHSGLPGRAIRRAGRQASSSSGGVNKPGRRDEVHHVLGLACNARPRGARSPAPPAKRELPERLRAKLRECLYGDGVAKRANEQAEAPWQRKMMLHHDGMMRIKH